MKHALIQETQLEHGPLLISRTMPDSQSVSLGIFINTGSRDEQAGEAGISHALEHMLFKGTKHHDVHTLTRMLDTLGGTANAFTTREHTCFHIRVLHEDWPQAMQLLMDMVLEPSLPADEWQREKEVIFSEMSMAEDSPDDWVMDQHIHALFPDQALGKPVLGTRPMLEAMGQDTLVDYHQRHYCAPKILVAMAGRVEHEALIEPWRHAPWGNHQEAIHQRPLATLAGGVQILPRDGEQAHMLFSWPGIASASTMRPVAWLANQVLGGGMSSRLFREVREKLGLAYSIGSHVSSLSDVGMWSISCSTEPEHLVQCVDVIRNTLEAFRQSLNADEIECGKRQLEVQLRMAMDSVSGNMLYLGSRFDEPQLLTQAEWAAKIHDVTLEQVHDWADTYLAAPCLRTFSAPEKVLMQAESDLRLWENG